MENFKLKDVSLNRYGFYLSELSGDSEKQIKEKKDRFAGVLEKAVKAVGGWGDKTYPRQKPEIHRKDGMNLLIAATEFESGRGISQWIPDTKNNIFRKFISRSLLDVYYLQTAVMKKGLTEASCLEDAISGLPEIVIPEAAGKTGDTELRTRGTCVYLELPTKLSSHSDEKIKESIENSFTGLKIPEPAHYKLISFDYAKIGILEDVSKMIWIVLAINNRLAAELVDNILSELFLSIAKIDNEYTLAKEDLKIAKEAKKILENYLTNDLPNKAPSLAEMEAASEKLSEFRADLAVKMNEMQVHLKAIKINIGNAERLLNQSLLAGQKEDLTNLLIKPLYLNQEQIEADLGSLETALTRGNYVNEKYKDITQIRLGYYGRALTLLFGLVSTLGILQLVKKFGEIHWCVRIPILAFLVLAFAAFAFGSKIFPKSDN
jgi:hypothetical protein